MSTVMTDYSGESMDPPLNLQAITLYTYQSYYLVEPRTLQTKINTNLRINRLNKQIAEHSKSEGIPVGFEKRATYSFFLGLLPVLYRTFILLVSQCKKICSIQGMDIYEIKEIKIIPMEQDNAQKEDPDKLRQIHDYVGYLRDQLMQEGFYFSYDYDLTLSRSAYAEGYASRMGFAWNYHVARALTKVQDRAWFAGVIQGSIRAFHVFLEGKRLDYYLITRRSWKKGGTRYNARGVNSFGHVANYCQSQQLLFINGYCFSHVQIRGSVPAFWSQQGIAAQVVFDKSHQETKAAFRKHFNRMKENYGRVMCLNLLSKTKSGEAQLTVYFQRVIQQLDLPTVRYEFYDLHFACKGQKFERCNILIDKLAGVNKFFRYYTQKLEGNVVLTLQNGVVRTNCLDCLDRTNLIQSKVALQVLTQILITCGFELPRLIKADSLIRAVDDPTNNHPLVISLKYAWADNGDMISKHYTGTGSTHTNVTRTGYRDLKGMMDHGMKSLGRLYKQYMEDNFKQEVIDLLIGEHTKTINLAEFEAKYKTLARDKHPGEDGVVDFDTQLL